MGYVVKMLGLEKIITTTRDIDYIPFGIFITDLQI